MTINELLELNEGNYNFRIYSGDEKIDIENLDYFYSEFGDCEIESWRVNTVKDDAPWDPYSRIDIRIVA